MRIYLGGIFFFELLLLHILFILWFSLHLIVLPASDGRNNPPSQKSIHTIHANGPSQSTPTMIFLQLAFCNLYNSYSSFTNNIATQSL